MSSTYPTSGVNAHLGLGLLGRNADKRDFSTPSPKSVSKEHSVAPNCASTPLENSQPNGGEASTAPLPGSHIVGGCAPPPKLGEAPQARLPGSRLPAAHFAVSCAVPVVYHRVAEVRQSQGLTERTVAKRMGVDIRTYRALECATTDLTLSQLTAIQKALDVPLVDLLVDSQALSRPVQERAKMVKTMKTAVAIRESQPAGRIGKLSKMLCEQLVDVMPELEEVGGWPQFGARRGQSSIGRVLSQPIDTSELRAD